MGLGQRFNIQFLPLPTFIVLIKCHFLVSDSVKQSEYRLNLAHSKFAIAKTSFSQWAEKLKMDTCILTNTNIYLHTSPIELQA